MNKLLRFLTLVLHKPSTPTLTYEQLSSVVHRVIMHPLMTTDANVSRIDQIRTLARAASTANNYQSFVNAFTYDSVVAVWDAVRGGLEGNGMLQADASSLMVDAHNVLADVSTYAFGNGMQISTVIHNLCESTGYVSPMDSDMLFAPTYRITSEQIADTKTILTTNPWIWVIALLVFNPHLP